MQYNSWSHVLVTIFALVSSVYSSSRPFSHGHSRVHNPVSLRTGNHLYSIPSVPTYNGEDVNVTFGDGATLTVYNESYTLDISCLGTAVGPCWTTGNDTYFTAGQVIDIETNRTYSLINSQTPAVTSVQCYPDPGGECVVELTTPPGLDDESVEGASNVTNSTTTTDVDSLNLVYTNQSVILFLDCYAPPNGGICGAQITVNQQGSIQEDNGATYYLTN